MIEFRSRGALYGECWYEETAPAGCAVDVLALRQRAAPVSGARARPFLTLINDLDCDEDALLARFGGNCRDKVKRAQRRDGLELVISNEPRERLAEFRAYYDAFAAQRGLRPANAEWLLGACAAGQLVLASAVLRGDVLAWHAYVATPGTAWLQHTVAKFRDVAAEQRQLVARANRWLHWRSMAWFRERGLERYDWGGLFEREDSAEQAGINRFKREFGGREVRAYDCYVPVTFKGRLRLGLNRLGDGLRAVSARVPRPRRREGAAAPA